MAVATGGQAMKWTLQQAVAQTANRQKKPVLIWCEQGKQNAPNWLFMMLPHEHVFGGLEELISYLSEINESVSVDHLKRWFFFDQDKLAGTSI